jgi:hypothetical protein
LTMAFAILLVYLISNVLKQKYIKIELGIKNNGHDTLHIHLVRDHGRRLQSTALREGLSLIHQSLEIIPAVIWV